MIPSLALPVIVAAFIGGAIFYSYHTGLTHGETVCNEEKLANELIKTRKELFLKEQLAEFQSGQIGEAQQYAEEAKLELEKLREKLSGIDVNGGYCIPSSVLDAIREYRTGRKNP